MRWFAPSGEESYERVGLILRPAGLIAATAIALAASLAVLIGLFVRDRRDFRQTRRAVRRGAY